MNVTMNDSSDVTIGSGINLISGYVAAVMNDCSVVSSSDVAVASSVHSYSFKPTQKLVSGSNLQINIPMWYGSTGS